MLFHCLYDSDWIIIWIAFNWQDFSMFALGSSASSLIQFWTFPGIYFFLSFFWERKSNLDADFLTALQCITHSTWAQPIQSAFKARWLSDPIIAANWKCEAQYAELGREGDLSQRCRMRLKKISHCWVVIPPAQSEVARCLRLRVVSQRLSSAPSLDVTLISL